MCAVWIIEGGVNGKNSCVWSSVLTLVTHTHTHTHTQVASTSNQAFHADEVEGVLDSMDIFTIELNRGEGVRV